MDLVNETRFAAEIYSGPSGEREVGCAIVVKGTWEIAEGGLHVAEKDPWPILAEEMKTPWGAFPAEGPSRKPWVDVIVLAFARPRNGEAVTSMPVAVSVGAFRHELHVTGTRRWEKTAFGFRPTDPSPFHSIPLTWANAFGGVSSCPTGAIPSVDNPEGKGFVFEPENAEGVELPNVEDPSCLVREPKDWPLPSGWGPYPVTGGCRLRKMMDETGRPRTFEEAEPYATGWAHPDLMVPGVAAGEAIAVDGVTGRGSLTAVVPKCPVKVLVEAGSESHLLPFRLDTLVVVAEERRLVARWRAATTVEMRPREVRLARVVMA